MITFDKAVDWILKWEGGDKITNDPSDRGGLTKYGISKRAYPKYDIKNLTLIEAKTIYKRDYWDKIDGDKIDPKLAMALFNCAVNMGVGRARMFKEVAKSYYEVIVLCKDKYNGIVQANKSQRVFLKGWMNRLNDLTAFIECEG